jgi:hypothetical protein
MSANVLDIWILLILPYLSLMYLIMSSFKRLGELMILLRQILNWQFFMISYQNRVKQQSLKEINQMMKMMMNFHSTILDSTILLTTITNMDLKV